MPQNDTQSNNNSNVKPEVKQRAKMAPVQTGTLKTAQKKLGTMLKTARVEKKKKA